MSTRRLAALLLLVLASVSMGYFLSSRIAFNSGDASAITVGVELNDHSAAFWVALDKGFFDEEGLRISYKTFSTGLELAVALSRGEFDIALACIGPVMVMYSRGVPVVLIAMTHLNGYSLISSSNLTSIIELDGADVTVSGPGSPTWLLARIVEDRYGIKLKMHKMPPFVAVNALLNHQVTAAFLPEHYATYAVSLGGYRLVDSSNVWSDMPGSGVFVRKQFLSENRVVIEKFVSAIYKAVEYIRENPEESALIVAKHLAAPVDIVAESMKHLDYTVKIDISDIKTYYDLLVRYGAIEHGFDIDEFVDQSILYEIATNESDHSQ